MSVRTRLVLAMVGISTVVSVAIGAWAWLATAQALTSEIDRSLADIARFAGAPTDAGEQPGDAPGGIGPGPGAGSVFVTQRLDAAGAIAEPASPALPVGPADVAIASGSAAAEVRDVSIDGVHARMLTQPIDGGGAVQVARSMADTDQVIAAVGAGTLVAVATVALLAALAGWALARQLTRRLVGLADAADRVAATGRLDVAVPAHGRDEITRVADAFGDALAALARSREAQQRLVQDAGHELRTPLTSLRANVDVLRRHPDLPPDERNRVLDDLSTETRDLTALLDELVDLAADRRDDEPVTVVALAPLVERAAERTRRRSGREVSVTADWSAVLARRPSIARAVANLLDNAVKFDPGGTAPIEVSVSEGTVAVADRGPGIAAADLGRVFDRFYRAAEARTRPGSGLGLSIVRDAAEAAGGTAFAEARLGGGAVVGMRLPLAPADEGAGPPDDSDGTEDF